MIKRVVYWLLILVACILTPLISKRIHREDISTVIERANALCQDNPEEAMALISTYDYKRDHHMRANAYYQHALTQKQHGYDPLAILSLTGAANSLTAYSDPHLEAEVYYNMGEIYYDNKLYSNSYDAYKRAVDCFERAEIPQKQHLAMYYLGCSAFKLYKYEEAKRLLNTVLDYTILSHNREFRNLTIHQLCDIHLYNKEYAMLTKCVELFDEHDSTIGDISHYNCMMAITSALNEDFKSASHYLTLAKEAKIPNDNCIRYSEFYINKCLGNDTKSIELLEDNIKTLEQKLLKSSTHPMLNEEIDLLKRYIDSIKYKNSIESKRDVVSYTVLALVIAILIQILIHIRHKMLRNAQQYIDTINELQLTRNNSKELEPLTTAIDRLYNDRLRDINQLCETYYEHSNSSSQAAKVFERVRQTIESIKEDEARIRELEELVDRCRDGLMSKLREECKKLNERELKVALYSYAGFSSRAICIFVDSNPVALSKIKYRIKTKIKEANCEDAEILISALN